MASLEDYLRNFAKAGSRQVLPSGQQIVIETVGSSTQEGEREYVPPVDGYVVVWCEGTSGISAEIRIDRSIQLLSANALATWGKAWIPCTRGQKLYYALWGSGFKQGEFYFVPSLGSQ